MVLAKGWALSNQSNPTFVDVPYGSTFYQYVETAVSHGIIDGYACGYPEPCDPQHRPYFRPGVSTTRGQLAKIAGNTFFPDSYLP